MIRAEQLVGVLGALNERQITFRAFRAYIGCFELLAIREAATRSAPHKGKRAQNRYLRAELAALVDPSKDASITRELAALNSAGLLTFAEGTITATDDAALSVELLRLLGSRGGKRLIPVPRQVLKFLAACTRPALAKTVIAYLLRGLSLERSGNLRSAGTVKISWICALCQISERAARTARADLIRLGWITKDTGSFQRKLNRDGAYFVINTAWHRVFKRSAPRDTEKCTGSAPPREKQETPYGSKDQKVLRPPQTAPKKKSGVCKANERETLGRPTLRDIKPEDLKRLSRVRMLYAEATAAKWLSHSEAGFLNFVAAAARATRVDGDAVRVFVGIVRRGLWHHLTNDDEERARTALKRERDRKSRGNQPAVESTRASETEKGSEDTVRSLVDLAMNRSTTGVSCTGFAHTGGPYTEESVSARNNALFLLPKDKPNVKRDCSNPTQFFNAAPGLSCVREDDNSRW